MRAIFLIATLAVTTGHGADPAPPAPAGQPTKHGAFVFSLLPKSFQRKPSLDFHVITEMSVDGKKVPAPTPAHPVYYVGQPGQYVQLGREHTDGEAPPPVAELQRVMEQALAANGYLTGSPPARPPGLVVIFNYGSFARFSTDFEDAENEAAAEQSYQNVLVNAKPGAPPPPSPTAPSGGSKGPDELMPFVMADISKRQDVVERAILVGGAKFGKELNDAITQEIHYQGAGGGNLGPPGDDPGSPFNRFRNRNDQLMQLVEDAFDSCYFVTATAYDYAAMAQGRRVILWRTKMTVNATGISMKESLPSLILTAGPYLGRDMTEAVTVTRRISRDGKVEIGPLQVVPEGAPPASTAKPADTKAGAPGS